MLIKFKKAHFLGIGGIGMSGIAKILLHMGYQVSGSDLKESAITKKLCSQGAKIYKGHQKENIEQENPDVIVVSTAIDTSNPEIIEALQRKIPIVKRAEMLNFLMENRFNIAVTGTHGKTTTTSMVSCILEGTGKNPTSVIGGEVSFLDGDNAKLGTSNLMVAEADESDGSLLYLTPHIAVITNIEEEHMNYYRDLADIMETFQQFLSLLPSDGLAVLGIDCPHCYEIARLYKGRTKTYGLCKDAEIRAENIAYLPWGSEFNLVLDNEIGPRIKLSVPGVHNVKNSLGAIAAALELGLSLDEIKAALVEFRGAGRRLDILYKKNGLLLLNDYAHHPTEIKATLQAVASTGQYRRIIAVFQPHRYTRTQYFLQEFAQAFVSADLLCLTDIYAASEKPIAGIKAETIAEKIREQDKDKEVIFISPKENIPEYIEKIIGPNDAIVVMGAGDISSTAEGIAKLLQAKGEEIICV